MALLLLGGTGDARWLAEKLHHSGVPVIYSIAGLVRKAPLPCQVISGGFSCRGGLEAFIKENDVDAVLNATHPFASRMSRTAGEVSRRLGLPYWRLLREPWQPETEDHWIELNSWSELWPYLEDKKSLLITAGQLSENELVAFAKKFPHQRQLLRTAMPPKLALPASMQWLKAIGPFQLENELAIMREHQVDALITKNSGGEATYAKLLAARELGLSVYLFQRPPFEGADKVFVEKQACLEFVQESYPVTCRDKHAI